MTDTRERRDDLASSIRQLIETAQAKFSDLTDPIMAKERTHEDPETGYWTDGYKRPPEDERDLKLASAWRDYMTAMHQVALLLEDDALFETPKGPSWGDRDKRQCWRTIDVRCRKPAVTPASDSFRHDRCAAHGGSPEKANRFD